MSGCFKGASDPESAIPKSCAEISDSVFPGTLGEPQYRVVSPNGGESFHVGEKMRVVVTSKEDTTAIVRLVIWKNGSSQKPILPESPPKSINLLNECMREFTIPDSIDTGLGKKISVISDSVKIFVAQYNGEDTFKDFSDGFFRIRPR